MKKLALLFLFPLFTFAASARQIELGLNPDRTRWNKIKTDRLSLIFPAGTAARAQRIAGLLDLLGEKQNQGIGSEFVRIPIILHPETAVANGFVAMNPWRSEFYMNAPQEPFLGTEDWADLLAIHEYRHVLQRSNSRRGVTKIASVLFGEYAWAALSGMAVPRWFSEGDAVLAETLFSQSGRGRVPAFNAEYDALLAADRRWSYEKSGAGSFKNFVPNHYKTGYRMVTAGRLHFGPEVWRKAVEDAGRFRGIFHPFSRSLRKQTGLRTKKLYSLMLRETDSLRRVNEAGQSFTEGKLLTAENKIYTTYRRPVVTENGDLIAEKSSFRKIRALYRIGADGKEEKITETGLTSGGGRSLHLSNNQLIWSELTSDLRFSKRQFSVVRLFDLRSKRKLKLTAKSRLFSPVILPGGQFFAAISADSLQNYRLEIRRTANGVLDRTLPNPEGRFLFAPAPLSDGKIAFVAQGPEGHALFVWNPESGENRQLTSFRHRPISSVRAGEDWLYFSAGYERANGIYAVKITEPNKIYRVVKSRFGAYDPWPDLANNRLIFSEYHADGYALKSVEIKPENFEIFNPDTAEQPDYFAPLLEAGTQKLPDTEGLDFTIEKFRKNSGLFHFYGVQPYLFHPVYRLELLGQNIFSTTRTTAGITYNANENRSAYDFDFAYGRFFPVFHLSASHGRRLSTTAAIFEDSDGQIRRTAYSADWSETKLGAGISLPLQLTHDNYYGRAEISAKYNFLRLDFDDLINNIIRDNYSHSIENQLVITHYKTQSHRQLYPSVGQSLRLSYRTTVASQLNKGSNLTARASLFFPGFFPTHSLRFGATFMKQDVLQAYKFSNVHRYARGYGSALQDAVSGRLPITGALQEQIYGWSADYALPLWYPDAALGGLAYFKRLKINVFYDFSRGQLFEQQNTFRSFGAEIGFDFRFFRLIDADFGLRFSRLQDVLSGPENVWEVYILRIGV